MKQLDSIRQKQKISNGSSRVGNSAKRPPVGVGWVIFNPEVLDYERHCMETNTVALLTDENEIINRCLVSSTVLQEITFPKSSQTKGSLVVWVSNGKSAVPVVVGVLKGFNQKNSLPKSNSFQFQRVTDSGSVMVEGVAEEGVVNILAQADKGGKVNLKALSQKLLAALDVYVQGDITIDAENSITIRTDDGFTVNLDSTDPTTHQPVKATVRYITGEGFTLDDQYGNHITTRQDKVDVQVPKNGVITTKGDQNAVEQALLGDSTVNALKDILDIFTSVARTVQTLNVNTATGTVLPNVIQQMVTVQQKIKKVKTGLNKLKSKNVKLS